MEPRKIFSKKKSKTYIIHVVIMDAKRGIKETVKATTTAA
jgi:hypothetical protein